MSQRFARQADRRVYGQRAQSETVNSMMKRNLGSALGGKRASSRERDMLLKVLTHDLMVVWTRVETEQVGSLRCSSLTPDLVDCPRASAATRGSRAGVTRPVPVDE